jgi:hypothetical protein
MWKSDAARQGMLLDFKAVELLRHPSVIYFFNANGLRGFQLGDPAKDSPVEVRGFDEMDHEFRFMFSTQRGSNKKLNQPDINEVIGSLRPQDPPDKAVSKR